MDVGNFVVINAYFWLEVLFAFGIVGRVFVLYFIRILEGRWLGVERDSR